MSETGPSSINLGAAPNARIHVLEVIGNAIVGGMESWVTRLIERLPRERFRFTALCPFESPFTDRLRALDVEVLIAPMPDDPPWSTIQMATALVATNGIDLLHAHLPKAHLLAGIVGRMTGKPVVATVHGRHLTTLDIEVHRVAATHLSVVCKQSYFHALGLGINAAQLSCDQNGVDTEVFRPRPRGGARLREDLGLTEDTLLVGFVGRLSHEKGPEVFVRAMMLLTQQRPDVHAVVVGEGPMEGELRKLMARFRLHAHLHLIGVRHDMPAVFNELDLLVSCSHSEAMPLALMEGMASGVAAVATRVGGVPDIVEHGQTGWLVAPGDFDDIAQCCGWLLNDSASRQRMGERARMRAVERFNLVESVARVGELLCRVARPRGEGARRAPQGLPPVAPVARKAALANGAVLKAGHEGTAATS